MADTTYAAAIDAMTERIDRTAATVSEGFPHFADPVTGRWMVSPAGDWTGGFWVGQLWLAHHRTGDDAYRRHALRWAERLRARTGSPTVFRGFLFYYGAALGSILADDATAAEIAVAGARGFASGQLPVAGAIPLGAGGEEAASVGDSEFNVDGVPGTALLAWAAARTGDQEMRDLAVSHARRHVELCVRDDGSVCQSATVDLTSGALVRRYTHKGIADDSTWTRAQAWAMIGYGLAARWFPDESDLLATAVRTCDWWCDHLPADGVTYWDFDAPQQAGTALDTSGTAIGAAALLKVAALLRDDPAHRDRAVRYHQTAEASVRALVDRHLTPTAADDTRPAGILTAGCYNMRIGLATAHELVWGSYHLYEALHALTGAVDPLAV